jgi:hypothetical protein
VRPDPDALKSLGDEVAAFGFGLIPDVLDAATLQGLLAEAQGLAPSAVAAEHSGPSLNYRARLHPLGPIAEALLDGGWVYRALSFAFPEATWALTRERSSYTYYAEGDYLDPHLDLPAESCDVTIIAYAMSQPGASSATATGRVLEIYGPTLSEKPVKVFPTPAGSVVFGRGSRIWHGRPRLSAGEAVIAVAGCYSPA